MSDEALDALLVIVVTLLDAHVKESSTSYQHLRLGRKLLIEEMEARRVFFTTYGITEEMPRGEIKS